MRSLRGSLGLRGSSERHGQKGGLEADALDADESSPYRAQPQQLWRERGIRIGLWTAVVVGAVAGVAGFLRTPSEAEVPLDSPTDDLVPAPVANFAELAVEEWLLAPTPDGDPDQLEPLYIEHPILDRVANEDLTVDRVVTIGGGAIDDGYWQVTVAADVVEPAPPDDEASDNGGDGDEDDAGDEAGFEEESSEPDLIQPEGSSGDDDSEDQGVALSRWYVEIGIVGDAAGGLAAVRAPAVVEEPPSARDSAAPVGDATTARPDPDDPLVSLIAGFLDAWLAGGGDPSRYVVNGATLPAVDPPPFASMELRSIGVEELGEDGVRAQVDVLATTPSGNRQSMAYELYARESGTRWELYEVSGAPTIIWNEDPVDAASEL